MSRKSKVLAFVMLMMFSVVASAQVNPVNKNNWNSPKKDAEKKKVKKAKNEAELDFPNDTVALLVGRPNDNWYIGVSLGVHMFSGNEKTYLARINPLTPQFGVKVGKWLTPSVALSANFDHGYALGQTTNNVYYKGWTGEYHSFKFLYYNLYGEVTIDWMNLTNNYLRSSRRIFHLQNTIGMGYAWQTGKAADPNREGKVSNYEMSFHIGFNNDFKVSDRVTIFLEPKLALIKGTWDNSPRSNTWGRMDMMISLSVGAKFNLGNKSKTGFVQGSKVKTEEIKKMKRDISKLEKENRASNAEIDSLKELVYELRDKVPVPLKILDVIAEDNLRYISVYFRIDEAVVDYSTETSLKTFASRIKRSPEETKFMIISSADKATGTPESNMILTQERCAAVYSILVDKYGVNPNKLENHPIGGIDHYEPDDMNRMTLIVESNEEIERILCHIDEGQK